MITIPISKPPIPRSNETDFGTSNAQAIWENIVRSLNWYHECLPAGLVMSFYAAQQYYQLNYPLPPTILPIPSPNSAWKFCDGSTIVDALSPLNGRTAPDLRNRMFRHGTSIGVTGGSPTTNLQHYHSVGFSTTYNDFRLDDGGERYSDPLTAHWHNIGNDLSTGVPITPPYIDLQQYILTRGLAAQNLLTSYTNLDDAITDFGDIVSVELLAGLKASIEYLNAVLAVGTIWPIMTNIPGVSINANIWQECNGSQITNPNSPLRSTDAALRYVPNLVDKFLKITNSLGVVGNYAGVDSYDFNHNHGGATGAAGLPNNGDTDDDHFTSHGSHAHSISTSAPSLVKSMLPAYSVVKYFMKIQ